MRWRRNLRFSWAALRRHRARTLLSVSGVAVGIAAMGVLLALEAGARQALERTLDELGSHLLVVAAARTVPDALRGAGQPAETLTRADAEAVAAGVSGIRLAAPVVMRGLLVEHRGRSLRGNVVGTTPELGVMRNDRLVAGRFLDPDDVDGARRVAVIGSQVRRELFEDELPLGEIVLLGPGSLGVGVPFTVVGVMKEKGNSPDGANQDDQVIVPVSAAQRRLFGLDYVDRIFLQAVSRPALDAATPGVVSVLRQRHRLPRDDFELQDQDAQWAGRLSAGSSMRRLVAGLAVLALGLGGSGLLAVSLLSVRERRSEIGLRLAVGARRRDIFFQFLAEAILLSLLGTAAGLAVTLAVSTTGERLLGWPLAVDWRLVSYPIGASLLLSAASGALPAYRAARWDPIAALRGRRN